MTTLAKEAVVGAEGRNTANDSGTLQLVGFRLGKEEYGIEITKVREIILMGEVTALPKSSAHMEGVINLRNLVIPIIDLRCRFGLPKAKVTNESRIMVVNVADTTLGIVVDAVMEVLRISRDKIAPPPPTVTGLGKDYLTGLVKLDERLLILLDIDRVFSQETRVAAEPAS